MCPLQQKVVVPNDFEKGKFDSNHNTDELSESLVRRGLDSCKKITKEYGTSFYFATQFFTKDVRNGIYAIYAFARIPDEIVDDHNKDNASVTINALEEWRRTWLQAMRTGKTDDPVMAAIVYTFEKYDIPTEEGEAFLSSMFMDLKKSRYERYEDLEKYMYGSAGVIGLMVTRIVGYHSDEAFLYAEKLGYAFQLTNFLRDIQEDAQALGRIYMPIEELQEAGLNPSDIEDEVYNDRFVRFMKVQIERNRVIYRQALPGIDLLKWRGRFAVKISYVLYKAILVEIERVNYNIYLGRVRTNLRQKLWLSLKALARIYE